ncbi:hypothetical protein DL98DRAFT_655830 [Cadophora sp. DSE1049]|nr:hypothetical protein DL98DRAFT_655830 [Cadophora sp. DSE1049]
MRILKADPTELLAYSNYAIPEAVRAKACQTFETGTQGRGALVIKEEERFHGRSAEEIREILDHDNPKTGDFVLIDQNIEGNEVVTYVGGWHDQSGDGLEVVKVEDERILLKLLMKLRALPSCWTNYTVANSSLAEDISMVLEGSPYDPHAEYSPLNFNDDDEDAGAEEPVYVVAEPGEWEEGPGTLLDINPPQDRVYRLKSEVAKANNLSNPWVVGSPSENRADAPPGSMTFAQEWLPRQPSFGMQIGALTSAWTHPPECARSNDSEICVFTNNNFSNGRGISIIAKSKDVADIDWIKLFTKVADTDDSNRSEGFHEALIPGKGVGLVADRNIAKGEALMSWTPLLVEHDTVYSLDPKVRGDLQDVAVERMSKEQQKMFLSQHRQWGGHRVSDIMMTNSFGFRAFGGLPGGSSANFPEVSRFNHACRPNVEYSFDSETLSQSMFATRTIHPGEELTITYVNIVRTRHERIHNLLTGWGFGCTCSHCTLPLREIDQSDQRINRIRELSNSCEDLWAANDTRCGLDLAVEYALLHQEEKITGSLMASAYYQVKMAAEVNGLDHLATKYSQLTLSEQLGDGYSQAKKLAEEQAKSQEAENENDAEDEGRLWEELSPGPGEVVISQVGEDAISLPV